MKRRSPAEEVDDRARERETKLGERAMTDVEKPGARQHDESSGMDRYVVPDTKKFM